MGWIARRFGTPRGAVRLALSYPQLALRLGHVRRPEPGAVRRLVFVCHGNICRSAYAEGLAKRAGLRTASFGLSTTSGVPAHPPVIEAAAQRGVDLAAHRATPAEHFQPEQGDLLLAMEVRHLARLSQDIGLRALPRDLLGAYCSPPVPHLHDPYEIAPEYLPACLDRIEAAVSALGRLYPNARLSPE